MHLWRATHEEGVSEQIHIHWKSCKNDKHVIFCTVSVIFLRRPTIIKFICFAKDVIVCWKISAAVNGVKE